MAVLRSWYNVTNHRSHTSYNISMTPAIISHRVRSTASQLSLCALHEGRIIISIAISYHTIIITIYHYHYHAISSQSRAWFDTFVTRNPTTTSTATSFQLHNCNNIYEPTSTLPSHSSLSNSQLPTPASQQLSLPL
jgi:hypothetical protein